jgi:hypothetical protein
VILGAVLALGACSSAERAAIPAPPAPPGTSSSSTTAAKPSSTTTTSTPEFSFDDSVPPPKLVNTGTNYVAILKSLESYGNWLGSHRPDPALVSTTIARGTKLNELFSRDLSRLRANGRRQVEVLGGPSSYTVLSANPAAFSMKVTEDVRSHRVVVPGGRVTSEVRYSGLTTYLVLVVLVDGHWTVATFDAQTPVSVQQ